MCGCEYNHHSRVEVFDREREDGQTVIKTPGSNVVRLSKFNPSPRRHAIRIRMECEDGHYWFLNIIQHKGYTILVPDFDVMQD
ncbi:hypothetical protein SAMN05421799_10653 [Alicyclobacillus vulcanalis]|uniref:Uncharacterized protein n=1 Tax=Alicyclobacillus vulcanalis TaxID=252246 RepID=A0A1N7MRN2_9BACL|nr:hypothetical protein SAMN05421799_10653 [Alicyclobacillus vulcanalis]